MVVFFGQAIAIRERPVKQEGRRELVGDLAQVRGYCAEALIHLGK